MRGWRAGGQKVERAGWHGRAVAMGAALVACNVLLWLLALLVFNRFTLLLGTAFLAYGFGLRHAVDADHIAAIDNVTRKQMNEGKAPVSVGLYFSLGHSSVVFALSAVVALMAGMWRARLQPLASFGAVGGTLISAVFLFAIAAMNLVVLLGVLKTFRRVRAGGVYCEEDVNALLGRRGFMGRVFRGLFRLISQPWQMYFVGLLFGLGFDTATEVGLLGISAAQATQGLPVWSIMMFPALFTAGMALIDTADGILMLSAYGWAQVQPLRKLYYNIIITAVSVLVAVLVGGVESLGLVQSRMGFEGWFWRQVAGLNAHFGLLGYGIMAVFVGAWVVSAVIYRLKTHGRVRPGVEAAE